MRQRAGLAALPSALPRVPRYREPSPLPFGATAKARPKPNLQETDATLVASYHLSVKVVSRSTGRSATAAGAVRAEQRKRNAS